MGTYEQFDNLLMNIIQASRDTNFHIHQSIPHKPTFWKWVVIFSRIQTDK